MVVEGGGLKIWRVIQKCNIEEASDLDVILSVSMKDFILRLLEWNL